MSVRIQGKRGSGMREFLLPIEIPSENFVSRGIYLISLDGMSPEFLPKALIILMMVEIFVVPKLIEYKIKIYWCLRTEKL